MIRGFYATTGLILMSCCESRGFSRMAAASPRIFHKIWNGRSGGSSSMLSSTTSQEEITISQDTESYNDLIQKLESITHLSRAQAVLGYDQQVFMPSSASAERGAQLAALATVIHDQKTNPSLLKLMDKASKEDLNDDQRRLLELERKSFVENERVPAELAAKAASLSASAYAEWVEARKADDFSMFSKTLKDCFDTAVQMAEAKQGSADDLYSFMLDDFEVGMPQDRMDSIFDEVQEALVPLIAKVLDSPTPPARSPLEGKFDLSKQQQLSEILVKAIGFEAENGRIDVSVHPFTSSMSPSDVRITSRFREDEWYQGLAGSIHEAGHAIYEQNLAKSALSIDTALSMGTHESQSLFWERHIGLSKPFWNWATTFLQEKFDDFDFTAEEVYGAVNGVGQSFIRVEADELTYPLHVILRYGIEKDVIAGRLSVDDIPARWNKEMRDTLNVEVTSDAVGCLQDVHWSALAFGYFPTYLIGAIAAAQLFHFCRADIEDIDSKIENGEFQEIKDWLSTKVHRHGRRYSSLDLMLEDQVGEKLNPKYFIDYLTNKYSDLYKI